MNKITNLSGATTPLSSVGVAGRIGIPALVILAAALLLASLKLPLWQMRLEAPQYRAEEALKIAVHPGSLRGDLRELSVLNQYIGVHVPPTLPQFKWLPATLVAGAALGVLAGLWRSPLGRWASTLVSGGLVAALILATVQALSQMHDIGHKRDQKTILAGIKDFTPPFLGTRKIAQFTVSSRFGVGAWLIGGALASQLGAVWLRRAPAATRLSSAPGLSPVTSQMEDIGSVSTVSSSVKAAATATDSARASQTGLKSGAMEKSVPCCGQGQHANSSLP